MEVEKSKLMALLQECQAELTRENRHLSSTGSERLIKEHRVSVERAAEGHSRISALLASLTLACVPAPTGFFQREGPQVYL